MIGKNPPKRVNFSDFITIFAMPVKDYLIFICNTKLSDSDDRAKLWANFCCLQF